MCNVRMEAFQDCILCGVRGRRLYAGITDRLFGVPGKFEIRQCLDCRLLWLDPRPVVEDTAKCYEHYYTHEDVQEARTGGDRRPLSALRETLRYAILCGNYRYRHLHKSHDLWCRMGPVLAKIPFFKYRAVYDDLRERFPRYVERADRLLIDIGCGRGDYLKRMKDLGWNVLGIEPDVVSAELAKKRGIPVIAGTLDEARLPDGAADQITLQHVIEHLRDPVAVIHECHRVLRKGGRMVIYTPNNESLGHRVFGEYWRGLEPPRHLFIFSKRSIKLLLLKTPFTEYHIKTVSVSSANIYDSSLLIQKEGRINPNMIRHQGGRDCFALKEDLMCYFGYSRGEEVEAVIYKS
jgi:SAM-dependent methyltransferase